MAAARGQLTSSGSRSRKDPAVMFIVGSKIQKVRLLHMKKSANKKGFLVDETLSEKVTHIISELETQDQVVKSLKKSHPSSDVEKICGQCHVVTLEYFTACMEEGIFVEVCDHHRLKTGKRVAPIIQRKTEENPYENAKYCCQRITPLHSVNKKFSDALELLEKHADFLGGDNNLGRALAFRKASAALRAYPKQIKSMGDVEDLYDLKGGKHCKRIIQELLEDGFSTEVENIQGDEWFEVMQAFTGIFGCGPATARKWYDLGHRTLDDIRRSEYSNLSIEQRKGLEHFTDLNTPVTRREAEKIHDIVKTEAERILPGVTVIMTGGFIRGKDSGHDVDFLISHPEEGREEELLAQLLQNLRAYLIYTDVQRNTYGEAPISVKRQSVMDHFERCFSIFKLPKDDNLATTSGIDEEQIHKDEEESSPPCKKLKTSGRSSGSTHGTSENESKSWIARRVDFVMTPASQHAFALMGWTGSRMFCRSIRDYANKEMNMILTSHGLFDKVNNCSLEAKTEREIFQHLKLPYREPHERNC